MKLDHGNRRDRPAPRSARTSNSSCLTPGEIVALDNRKGRGRPREAAGTRLMVLPPYAPADRTDLRQAQGAAAQDRRPHHHRSLGTDLWAAIAEAIDSVTPDGCGNYFAKAGDDLD
jgi:hypothetical protein